MRRRKFIGLAGAWTVCPAPVLAQQAPREIGILVPTPLAEWALGAFRKGLDEAGHPEGREVNLLVRSAGGQVDRLPALAAELVARKVAVIFASGGPIPTRAAKAATSSIPIVFAYGGDPIADGLVTSFNRPDGNVTGATFFGSALSGKRLEVLRDIVPQLSDIALLVNPKGTLAAGQIKDTEQAATALGLRLRVFNASSEAEANDAFAAMAASKTGAVMIGVDPLFGFALTEALIALAQRYKLPSMFDGRHQAALGGLLSYGPVLSEAWRQAGVYAGRILGGDQPSTLPVVQPTKFELVINLKTAKALGLDVPSRLLFTADEVIE